MVDISSKTDRDTGTEEQEVTSIKSKKDLLGIYDRYSPSLYNLILEIVKDEGVAQEVLQYSFQKIQLRIQEYNPSKEKIFTWISRLVKTTANNKIKFQKHLAALICASSVANDKMTEREEEKHPLDGAELLHLLYFKCQTADQISESYNIPLDSLKLQIREALRNYRR